MHNRDRLQPDYFGTEIHEPRGNETSLGKLFQLGDGLSSNYSESYVEDVGRRIRLAYNVGNVDRSLKWKENGIKKRIEF